MASGQSKIKLNKRRMLVRSSLSKTLPKPNPLPTLSSSSMALSKALASKSQLFRSLLLPSPACRPFFTVARLAPRSVFSDSSESESESSDENQLPFSDDQGRYCMENEEDAVYARVDLPGVPKEGLKVWRKNDTVFVRGEEMFKQSVYSKELESPRKYNVNIDLPKDGDYNFEEMKAVMESGVLRVVVPKVKPDESQGVFNVKVE